VNRARAIFWCGAAVSAAVLVPSAWALFDRIGEFNAAHPHTMFYFQPVTATAFAYAGHDGTITETIDDDGGGTLTVTYADASLDLPVAIRKLDTGLTLDNIGLNAHADWFRLLRMIEGEPGRTFADVYAEVNEGDRPDRLIAVTRTPTPGDNEGMLEKKGLFDPDIKNGDWGWGEVMRRQWVFDFYEFTPDGRIVHTDTLRFPEARYLDQPREGELRQGTWQWSAALYVMPKGSTPKYNFTDEALTRAGWPLGAVGVSTLALLTCLGFALAPQRKPW